LNRRSCPLRRGRNTLLLLGSALGALLALPARAANYYEMNGPLRHGTGGATWISSQNPIARGAIDVATGAYLLQEPIVTLRARQPYSLSWFFTSQDASAGPLGPGTSLSCDWFVARSQAIAGQPYELIAPGSRHFAFNATPNGSGDYFNDRDPELLGATLHVTSGLAGTLRWKDGRKYTFDANGALIRLEDRHGNAVTIERLGPNGFASKISIDANRYLTLTYDAANKLVNVTARYKQSSFSFYTVDWLFAYNATSGYLASMSSPAYSGSSRLVTQYQWGTYARTWNGQTLTLPILQGLILPKGNDCIYQSWDSSGRITNHRAHYLNGLPGGYWTASYSAALGSNGTTTVTDPRGNVSRWTYAWNPSKYGYLVSSTTDALGRTTSYERTATPSYLTTAVVDFRGRRTAMGWDKTRGNLTSVTLPTASGGTVTWTATYETTFSQLTTVTDPLSRQTVHTVSPTTGDTTAIKDARNFTTSFSFAANGDQLSTTNALNQITQLTYDPEFGDLLTVKDPANHQTTYRVTARSLPFDVTDANGKKVTYTFDPLERLTQESRTLGTSILNTQYFWDGNGHRITVRDPAGSSWSELYSQDDRIDTEVNPRSESVRYEYDINGNQTKRTDRNGQWISSSYGIGDRLDGMSCYKATGVLESTVSLAYDQTTKLLASVTDNEFGSQTWSWSYDSLDRITGVSSPNGTVTYTLDNLGRRTGMTASGQSPISYGFSPIDQVTSIVQGGQTSSFVYDALARMTKRTLPNGVSTDWAFDSAGFLASVISKRSGTTFDSHVYTRDNVGNITQENRNGSLDSFSYNDLYEITSATVGGLQYLWQYDGLGNRLREDKGFQRTDYLYDAANCVLQVGGRLAAHDPNGNITSYGADTYTWDVRGRLVKLARTGLTIDFTYDPWGSRTSKKVNGTLTKFLLDGDSVVSEVTGATTVNTLQGPTLDEPLARNGRYFSPNHLGSTTTLTDTVGSVVQSYLYGPFGDVTQSTAESNPFQFAARENDGTGLYYNRKRYYSPEWGRFISEDPIGFAGGLNRYVYVGNNPLRGVDPDGTTELPGWARGVIIGTYTGIGAVVGGLGGGGVGGGVGFIAGLLGGPTAILTGGAGVVAGAAVGSVAGAGVGAVIGNGVVTLIEGPPDIYDSMSEARRQGGGGDGGSRTVREILAGKRASVRRAELDPGSPSWDDILDLTLDEIDARARQNLPGYKTFWKLLTSKRFDK
jgi:RHS repeat-associated protein